MSTMYNGGLAEQTVALAYVLTAISLSISLLPDCAFSQDLSLRYVYLSVLKGIVVSEKRYFLLILSRRFLGLGGRREADGELQPCSR